jgi:PRTRC genetic system protein E
MLIATLAPLLSRLSLKIDMQSAGDDKISLTVVPRRREGAAAANDGAELRPIALTGTVAELDAELAKGEAGALAQIVGARKALSDQIAEQIEADQKAAEESRKKAAEKTASKTKPAAAPATPKSKPTPAPAASKAAPAPTTAEPKDDWPDADAESDGPASLW